MSETWPPSTEQLGTLTIDQVYVEYDGPRLFLCSNRAEQLFLFLSVQEGPDLSRWLVVPISRRRLALVTSNRLDLHATFGQPEETAFQMDFAGTAGDCTIRPWAAADLTDDVLPDRGTFLNVQPLTTPEAISTPIGDIARQLWRHVTTLKLILPNPAQHDIPVKALTGILGPLQDSLNVLHPDYKPASNSTRGSLPDVILRATQINAFAIAPGSVELYLSSNEQADLFGNAILDVSADRLRELVECRADQERLQSALSKVNSKAARHYTRLLHGIVEVGASLEIGSASPATGARVTAKLTSEEARAAKNILDLLTAPEIKKLEITARLLGGVVPKRRFLLVDLESLQTYKGDVSDEAYQAFERAELSAEYRCRLTGETTVKLSTGVETTQWLLTSLQRIDAVARQDELPMGPDVE